MELEKIKTQTTWNDASASINSNFAKILQALGGSIPGGGGSADDTLVRRLYYADDEGETLTEEQREYNVETYTMVRAGTTGTPMVVLDGMPCAYSGLRDGDDYIVLTVTVVETGLIIRYEIELYSDGTVEFPEDRGGMAPTYALLDDLFTACMYWMYREIIPEAKGGFLVDGVVYEVDSWGIKDNTPQVEYNEGNRRYRVLFNPNNAYTITGKIDITPAGGGGSIDPELLEGYLPMMREFSDDFNNDFSR